MITVTGANGHLGRHAVAAILAKYPHEKVVAAVRNPDKAKGLFPSAVELRHADYDRPETLKAALAGTDKLLFISSSELGKRQVQHEAVIDAAKRAGVQRLVYTSVLHADKSGLVLAPEHRVTEQAVRASGIPSAILRNGLYFENQTENLGPALANGALVGSAGEGRISGATRADYAEAAVIALFNFEPSRIYELAGDNSYSQAELAAELSRQFGKPIAYQTLPPEQYKSILVGAGLPDVVAGVYVDIDLGIARGELEDHGGELKRLLGRPTTPLSAAVSAGLAAQRAA